MSFPIPKRIETRLEPTRTCGRGADRIAGPGLAIALAATLGACSISMPIASLVDPASRDDKSGSIGRPSLARLLEDEDLRRAKAALATALDPRANGSVVAWENPQTGNKGSFTPRGSVYPEDAKICRGFRGEIERKGDTKTLKGTACADNAGEWTIAQIDPLKDHRDLD